MSQASDSMSSGAEIGQAISFFESSPAIVRRSPWVFKGREGAIAHFVSELEIIGDSPTSRQKREVSGMLVGGHASTQEEFYTTLSEAVQQGRFKKVHHFPDVGLDLLSQGENVASVYMLGPEEEALHCDIIGFRMPSFMARCAWKSGSDSFVVQSSPDVIRDLIAKRRSIEDAWFSQIGGRSNG